ncbi:hypothetical protein AURDEDRAFT_176887 [Auricularia subglabra TFB-10046 SS5]|uniref:Uncharacterized protein n=1 Tax=Auricularia subglabra (strain TFB-10046 / SS5) TaxID=717982 RepID=J0D5L3_AURST|nr:hypothetical protein AURDEDRAFT_176887 [Auricularia subglabra TFB-10046 SS5]
MNVKIARDVPPPRRRGGLNFSTWAKDKHRPKDRHMRRLITSWATGASFAPANISLWHEQRAAARQEKPSASGP